MKNFKALLAAAAILIGGVASTSATVGLLSPVIRRYATKNVQLTNETIYRMGPKYHLGWYLNARTPRSKSAKGIVALYRSAKTRNALPKLEKRVADGRMSRDQFEKRTADLATLDILYSNAVSGAGLLFDRAALLAVNQKSE